MRRIRFHLRTAMAQHSDVTGHRITYDVLRRETGISPNTLSHIANSKLQRVDLGVLERLCDFFGCELHDLMRLEDAPSE